MQQVHNSGHTSSNDGEYPIQEEQERSSSQQETLTVSADSTSSQSTGKATKQKRFQFLEKIAISTTIALFGTLLGFVQWQIDAARGVREQEVADQKWMREQETAVDNQRHQILSGYFDQMTGLLLGVELNEDNPRIDRKLNDEAKPIARARTLSTLRQLDGERKGELLKFLYEAGLIGGQCQPNPETLHPVNCQNSILNLDGARLSETKFDRPISLPGIDLTQASLPKAVLPEIDLTRANMYKANLNGANLEQAILFEAQMESISLVKASLVGAELTTAKLRSAVLEGANLQAAILIDATLSNADLTGANLNNARLQGADLTGANLNNAMFQGADFKGAKYNRATDFPEGFDPVVQGMVEEQ